MNFKDAASIASVIENLKDAEKRRAPNRALVDSLFNGSPPYSKSECDENKIQWNVNWNEGADLLLQAREQLENAHLSTDYAFTVRLPDAPKSKASLWGQLITKKANKLLRGSRPYFHTQRSKLGSVVLHGSGSQMWSDAWSWCPNFVAVGDLLIPTDTELPLDNLNHFAVKRKMSPGQLFRKTFGRDKSHRDPAWQMDSVAKILDKYTDVNQNPNQYNFAEHPEQMAEIWKQNSMYYETDAVPVIWMWDFYYQDDESVKPCWYRKILPDKDWASVSGAFNSDDKFPYLYNSEKPHADKIDEILHIQFLDGNNVPPFMYHACRGLGVRLHDAVHALNRLRCQFIQKVFEDMMLLFRATDPVDRSRLDKIYLGMNYGIIPDGLSFVRREERYSPDPRLVEMQLSQLKQLVGEGSSQYTQDIDNGTNKERTAYEVSALLNQTTRLTGSMLNLSYLQEGFAYQEICRRLTLKQTLDWEVKRFRNELLEAKIPEKWIDSSRWEIEPVRVLGSGNTQLEQAQATALLNVRPMLNPEAQNEVMNDYVYAITHDPKRANRLAPLDSAPHITDSVHDTEIVYGSLLSGSQVTPRPGLVPAEVCATMLRLMGQTVQQVMQMGGVGTSSQVMGLQNALRYTAAFIQQIAQDKTQSALAKQFADGLGQIGNMVKAMAQRQQEMAAKQNGNGADPEAMQKLMANQAMTQQKLQAKEMSQQQKLTHKQQDFEAGQQRKNLTALADVHNKSMQAAIEAGRQEAEPPEQPHTPGE